MSSKMIFLIFFIFSISSSSYLICQVDLSGYQEYRFGISHKHVASRLHSQGLSINKSTPDEILVTDQIHLSNLYLPISIEKSFSFYEGALWCVTITYKKSISFPKIDSVYAEIKRLLAAKYGVPQIDTIMRDKHMVNHLCDWQFKSGFVNIFATQFSESVKEMMNDTDALSDFLKVNYVNKAIKEQIDKEKQKKTIETF
jgi:hypothetical protein